MFTRLQVRAAPTALSLDLILKKHSRVWETARKVPKALNFGDNLSVLSANLFAAWLRRRREHLLGYLFFAPRVLRARTWRALPPHLYHP